MDRTKIIKLSPAQLHILKITALSQGLSVEEYVAITLSRFFRAVADLKGVFPVEVHPRQIELARVQTPANTHSLPAAEQEEEKPELDLTC